jgi:DnaA family protein
MQLPLPVTLPVDETFDSIVDTGNQEVVALLSVIADTMPAWREAKPLSNLASLHLPLVTLLGASGTGKSHLLYSLCHRLEKKQVSHLYLNLANCAQWSLDIFDGLENLSLICLDNIHAVAGNPSWEEALFDLFNRVIENPGALIVGSTQVGPSHKGFMLPDLRSRLAWGVIYHLHPLDEAGRKEVVRFRAKQRGLKLSEQALQFLLHHSERDLRSLLGLLARLDTRSLQEQKKLSVAMVKRELGDSL